MIIPDVHSKIGHFPFGDTVDGDKHIIKELKFLCPDLIEKYGLILEGRKNFEKFEQKCVETVYIK